MADLSSKAAAKFYLPGDPRQTEFIKQLSITAALLGRDTVMFVTAPHWRQLVAEMNAQHRDKLMDPTRPAPWDKGDAFVIRQMGDCKLTVVNTGTDDEAWVNAMNRDTPGAVDYIERRDHFRVN